jgi:hydrogenase-4 component E
MQALVDPVLILVLLMNFLILGTSEIGACIRAAAAQGALLASLPILVHGQLGPRAVLLALGTAAIKGLIIPSFLNKAMRDARIRHEVEPFVGYVPSLFLCALGTAAAVLFAGRLPVSPEHRDLLLVPASLATRLAGFLGLTTRRKAISQVVGYLVLENGVFIFGLLLLDAVPFLVELGVLLDLVVAIFVMGIVINDIQREFSSLDTDSLGNPEETE